LETPNEYEGGIMKPSEYLKGHWWCGDNWSKGQECIATVITSTEAKTGINYRVWEDELIRILGCNNISGVFRWNDSPERTLEEVLEVARKAEDLILGNAK